MTKGEFAEWAKAHGWEYRKTRAGVDSWEKVVDGEPYRYTIRNRAGNDVLRYQVYECTFAGFGWRTINQKPLTVK